MATAGKTSLRTQLQYGDGEDPELFTTLAEVRSIEPPEQAADAIDATSHDSTAAEFIAGGVIDNGEVGLDALFVNDATDQAVIDDLGAAGRNWQLSFPDFGARTKTFTADAETDVLTAGTHGLTTGQPVRVSSTDTLPPPLLAATTYYAGVEDADTIKLYPTNADAVAGSNEINISGAGTGTHSLLIGTRLDVFGLLTRVRLGRAARGEPLTMTGTLKISGSVTLTP